MSCPCLKVSNSSYSPQNKTATPHSILHSPHVLSSAYLTTQISTTFTQWFSFWCGKEPSIFSPQSSGSYLIWGHSTTPSYAYLTVSRSINMLCHWHVGWQLEKLLHRGQLSSSKSTMSHLSNSTSRTSAKDCQNCQWEIITSHTVRRNVNYYHYRTWRFLKNYKQHYYIM